MDWSARDLGVDPVELRRRNFIPREKFPYRSVSGELYDVGDFERVLDRALIEGDVAGFAARKAESARAGRLRGLGLCYYIESILGDQNETTTIAFADDGMVELLRRHAVERAGARDGVRADPRRAERHSVREDPLRAGRQRPDRQGRRHRRVALGDDAGELDQPRRRPDDRPLPAAGRGGARGRGRATWCSRTAPTGSPGPTWRSGLMELAEVARREGRRELLTTTREFVVPGRSYPERGAFRRGGGRSGDRADRGGEVHGGRRLRLSRSTRCWSRARCTAAWRRGSGRR